MVLIKLICTVVKKNRFLQRHCFPVSQFRSLSMPVISLSALDSRGKLFCLYVKHYFQGLFKKLELEVGFTGKVTPGTGSEGQGEWEGEGGQLTKYVVQRVPTVANQGPPPLLQSSRSFRVLSVSQRRTGGCGVYPPTPTLHCVRAVPEVFMPMNFQATPAHGLQILPDLGEAWTGSRSGTGHVHDGGRVPQTHALESGGTKGGGVGLRHPQQGLSSFYIFFDKKPPMFAFLKKIQLLPPLGR